MLARIWPKTKIKHMASGKDQIAFEKFVPKGQDQIGSENLVAEGLYHIIPT